MLYIHSLKDLNPKTVDIESVSLIREVKKLNTMPLSEEKLAKHLAEFLVSQTDMEEMSKSLNFIPEAINDIIELSKSDGKYELINLQRALSALQELSAPLDRNIDYAAKMKEWQELFMPELTSFLNQMLSLKTANEKKMYEDKLKGIFKKILRNDNDFVFNSKDIVNEGSVQRINSLAQSMKEGFFFHVKMEDYLKKSDFNTLKGKIPQEDLDKVNSINQNIIEIQKGIERAYNNNMRMLTLAVVLYAYIKWLKENIK
jgi:hypothetical protein